MKYYLDCEFNGMGGELLSLALVPEVGEHGLYLADRELERFMAISRDGGARRVAFDPWVWANVLTKMDEGYAPLWTRRSEWAAHIETLLRNDHDVTIITDWPDDIKYFCELIITGPGTMIDVRPSIKCEMHRVDAYPTELPGAVQHNAYWDAMALRHKLQAEPAQ